MTTMSHVCIRVLDLDRSLTFYRDALGLVPQREMTMEDRGWHLVFLGDNETPFQLELCKEIARTQPYHLGDDTPHVAVTAQGPVLIEGNAYPSVQIMQTAGMQGLKRLWNSALWG